MRFPDEIRLRRGSSRGLKCCMSNICSTDLFRGFRDVPGLARLKPSFALAADLKVNT